MCKSREYVLPNLSAGVDDDHHHHDHGNIVVNEHDLESKAGQTQEARTHRTAEGQGERRRVCD